MFIVTEYAALKAAKLNIMHYTRKDKGEFNFVSVFGRLLF